MTGSPTRRARRQRFDALVAAPDFMDKLCEHIGHGHGLTSFAQGVDVPISSLHDYVRRDPIRAAQYDQARIVGAHTLVESSLAVFDDCERNTEGELTGPGVQLAKAKSETMRWLAGKLAPRHYGEVLALKIETVAINIQNILDRREQRLRRCIEGECTTSIAHIPDVYARDHTDFLTTNQPNEGALSHD